MAKKKQSLYIALVGSIAIAFIIAFAGGSHGQTIGQFSIFSMLVLFAFAINWLAYIPAMLVQTEHYYDLIGAITYISIVVLAVTLSSDLDPRAYLAATMVFVWAARLGTYLFLRVKRYGKDSRFDELKVRPLNFLVAWTMQALWVVLTAACALVIITNSQRVPISWLGVLGLSIWCFGITIEIVADYQKSLFKRDSTNKGKFINRGLWAWSQHPNYFGEIVLWTGMAIFALPVMSGTQWLCLISPLFVFVLLRYVSGVNLSHEIGDKRWGDDPAYQLYRQVTPVLVLKPPAK